MAAILGGCWVSKNHNIYQKHMKQEVHRMNSNHDGEAGSDMAEWKWLGKSQKLAM
jgi:hypothetical protein